MVVKLITHHAFKKTAHRQENKYVYGLKMEVNPEEIIEAVKKMKKRDREEFLEDLLAATCPEYLSSIREARAEYKAGRTASHKDVFGQ